MMIRNIFVSVFSILSVNSVCAQPICYPEIPETSNADKFAVLSQQEVWHRTSNLVFTRCSVGQTFDGETCVGEATLFTWQQALELNRTLVINQNSMWRLPNIKELSVIVERNCVRPSINASIFPETPPDEFWTSTPVRDDETRAWSLAFTNGTSSIKDTTRTLYVRLVRVRLPTDTIATP